MFGHFRVSYLWSAEHAPLMIQPRGIPRTRVHKSDSLLYVVPDPRFAYDYSQRKLFGLETFQLCLFLVMSIFSTKAQSIRKSRVVLAHFPTRDCYRESKLTRDVRDLRVSGFLSNF